MTVNVTKPAINVREKLAELDKPSGLTGEQVLRAETLSDVYSVLGTSRNMLINGSFDVWQRGTSWTSGGHNDIYTADRWHMQRYAANNVSVTKQAGAQGAPFPSCLRIGRLSGDTATTAYYLNQPIEQVNCFAARGKWVTLSFWVRVGAGFHINGQYFNSNICWHSNSSYPNDGMYYQNFRNAGSTSVSELDLKDKATTQWKRFEHSAYIPEGAIQLGVAFGAAGGGTAGTDDYFEVTGVQLEIGRGATPFEHRSIAHETALCQRYYNRWTTPTNWAGYQNGTTIADFSIFTPVPMRGSSPSLSCSGSFYVWLHDGYQQQNGPAIGIGTAGTSFSNNQIYCQVGNWSGLNNGYVMNVYINALEIDDEL